MPLQSHDISLEVEYGGGAIVQEHAELNVQNVSQVAGRRSRKAIKVFVKKDREALLISPAQQSLTRQLQ